MDWQSIIESAGIFATKFLVLLGITGFAAAVVYGFEVLTDKVHHGSRRRRQRT